MLQHPITLTRKYSPKFVIKHLRRTNLGSTTLYRILQQKKIVASVLKRPSIKANITVFCWLSRRKNYRNSCCTPYCSMISPVLNVDEWRISLVQGRARLPPPPPFPCCYVKTKLRPTYLLFFSNTRPPPPPPRMFPTPYLISIKTGSINDVTFFKKQDQHYAIVHGWCLHSLNTHLQEIE